MLDNEGSVEVDGEGMEADPEADGEESTVEGLEENQSAEASEDIDNQGENAEEGGSAEGQGDSEDTEEGDQGEGEGKKTDKGTNLDPDPLSQANQLRANAERKQAELEEFFSDPKNVRSYLAELEKETGAANDDEEDLVTDPSQIQTTADLQSYAKFLKKEQDTRISALEGKQQQDAVQKEREATVSRVGGQITEIKQKYPELRQMNADGTPNPDFDEELESDFGQLIFDLDFDPNIVNSDGSKGNFRGAIDYGKVADRFMKAAQRGATKGSKKAQTIVKDKSGGRIKGGGSASDAQPDESNMSASQLIAARMQRARNRR